MLENLEKLITIDHNISSKGIKMLLKLDKTKIGLFFFLCMWVISFGYQSSLAATESLTSKYSPVNLGANDAISEKWHKVILSGNANEVKESASEIVEMLEDGNYYLAAIRKKLIPASKLLFNATKQNALVAALALSTVAMIHTGYYGFKAFNLSNGQIGQLKSRMRDYPAFNFGNLSRSFIPYKLTQLVYIPMDILDVVLETGFGKHNDWPFFMKRLRWVSRQVYYDGVVWFAIGGAISAASNGVNNALQQHKVSDHLELELFFKPL